jgi:hypothetical protein
VRLPLDGWYRHAATRMPLMFPSLDVRTVPDPVPPEQRRPTYASWWLCGSVVQSNQNSAQYPAAVPSVICPCAVFGVELTL